MHTIQYPLKSSVEHECTLMKKKLTHDTLECWLQYVHEFNIEFYTPNTSLFVCEFYMVGIWFFSSSFISIILSSTLFDYTKDAVLQSHSIITHTHTHSARVWVRPKERKTIFQAFTYGVLSYMDGPSIHHLKHKNLNLWNVPWKTD